MESINKKTQIQIAINKGYTCNPETGEVFGARGNRLNQITKGGYKTFKVQHDNKSYRITHHQFIWYCSNGDLPKEIDHINKIKVDNRIENLREVSHQQNMWNRKSKGAYFKKKLNKWQSLIGLNGKVIYLGVFDTELEAKEAYTNAKKIYHI